MPGNASVEQRLQRLEDLEEIRRLFLDYGHFLDQKDFSSYARLFAADGAWRGGIGEATGPDDIEAMLVQAIGNGTGRPSCHLVANPRIELDGDRARARVTWVFLVGDEEDGSPKVALVGHYDDELVREGGSWRFLRRLAPRDIPVEAGTHDGARRT